MAQQHKEGEEDCTMKTSTQQQEVTNSSINPSDLIRFLSDISQLNIINDAAGFEEPNDTREESVLQSRQRTDSNAQENERLLATRVRELFGLDETEPFEAEYSCWLMNDVLLQGYMYLTKHYLLFFAYNPRENPAANKTGFLNKQQRNPPHLWERRWCVLQDGVLSYYQDSQQLFQPVGAIDLRNLSHLEVNTSQKNVFKLIGLGKTYNFEAGSDVSFLEWKKAIELSMFQIRKGGKNITLTVPLAKISNISIAPSNALFVQALDYQDFAMEEYYFMFFRDVAKTEQHLKRLWSDAENEGLGESGAVVLAVSDELSQEPSKESPSDVNGRRTWLPFGLDSVPDTIGQMLVNVRQMVSSDDDPVSVRREFSLPSNEEILSNFAARLEGSTSLGKLYITNRRLCFEALYPLRGTRVIVRYSQIEKIEKLATFIKSSLRVQTHIQHQKEFVFDFTSRTERDSAYLRISTILEQSNEDNILGVSTLSSVASVSDVQAQQTTNPLFPATKRTRSADVATFLFDQPHETHVIPKTTLTDVAAMTFTPLSGLQRPDNAPQHFTMITIGSRGDVQPLVALAKGLMAQGHTVRIATHAEFGDWIRSHGIQFHELAGNPAELLELMAQHSIFSTAFIKRGVETFLSWFNQLLMQSWEAAKGTNAVIASPYSFAGYHVAEALGVPFYYFCPFPFTPTKAFPQPLITSDMSMGGSFNYLTHLTMDTVLWQVLRPRINAWRVNVLKIPAISFKSDSFTPVINCFSQDLIPPPPDWSDFVHICGFFFLDNPNPDWHPSPALLQFMNDPLKKVVYIGFGSIVVDDPESMTDTIVEAVRQANVKAILAKGWSGRSKNVDNAAPPREYPDFIFPLNAVPHDWLFPKIAAVVHHGGAGTTAAGLRAGVPTIIKPFFGDQYFWAERIKELNVGVGLRDLTVESLSSALITITTNQAMITKAKIIGRTISQENGVENAIECIYRDLDYANSLAQKQRAYHQSVSMPAESGDASDIQAMEAESSLPLESTKLATAKLTDFEELGRSVRALEEANRELRERVATLELGFDQMRKDQQKLLAQDSS